MTATQPSPVPYSELIPSNPFLSKEEREALESKKKALDALLDDKELAKYKIEIMFGKDFAPSKPSVGIMSFWESGSKFHGGGDTILHICPGKKLGRNECDAFITDPSHGYGFLVCPKCHKTWNGDDVYGQLAFRLPARKWAEVVLKYFMKLDMKSDVVVKYHPSDIRSAAAIEQARQVHGDVLESSRIKRAIRIYPLKNIIKDISAGADLEGRFYAFLRA